MDEELQCSEREQLMRALGPGLAVVLAALVVPTLPAFAEVPSAVAPGHVPEPDGFYQGAMHGYTPNGVKGGTVVDTAALAKLIDTDHPLLLDVAEKDRKPESMGKDTPWLPTHRSLPGAVFLQGGGNGTSDPSYGDGFKARLAALTGGDLAKPIVTFCHPDCWGSYNAARRLAGLGYTHVYWYRDGVEGWQGEHDTRNVKPDATWVASLGQEKTQ